MSSCNVFNSSLFGNCLTDLSVTELLLLKQSLNHVTVKEDKAENRYLPPEDIQCPEAAEESCLKPSTMALVAEERGYAAPAYPSHDPWQAEEKPSKLQTLFQISVTALAFLSFGGYLLCLIVQSIKSKGTTFFHPVATTMATTNGAKRNRIKIYRRNRRSSLPPIEAAENYNYQSNLYNNPYQYYEHKNTATQYL